MSDLINLQNINLFSFLTDAVVIIICFKTVSSLIEWIFTKCGLEFKWMRRKREDHDLLVATVQNLEALQKRHESDVEQSIKHDKAIKNDLDAFMEQLRETNKETQLEIKQFAENRVHDREQSFAIQKELNNAISLLATTGTLRDEQINSLVIAQKETLADRINQKYKYYLSIKGIPEDEVDEFISLHTAYNVVGGNHNGDAKFKYCMEQLPIIPVEVKLKLDS